MNLLEIKTFTCCNKRYTWLPSKDTILADNEDPPVKARLLHACEKRAIWVEKTRMWFKKLHHEETETQMPLPQTSQIGQ